MESNTTDPIAIVTLLPITNLLLILPGLIIEPPPINTLFFILTFPQHITFGPKLTKLPECIGDLPKLVFLNLKGTTNVQIPQSIQDKGTDMGKGIWDLQ